MKTILYILIFVLLISYVHAEGITIKGIVLDRLDNLVGGAELKLDCLNQTKFNTDKFGSFSIQNVPSENCRIYASFKDGIGFKDLNLNKNQTYNIEIKLDKTIITIPKKNSYNWLIIPIFVILILILFTSIHLKIFKKNNKVPTKTKELKSNRIQDILKTLNIKEKKIVEFLLENKYHCSQAKIRHNIQIPRTSLSRCLKELEIKQIITIEKLGKMVKIQLTDWFLNKK